MSEPTPIHEAALTVSAVAARLGIAPATLRTWDRRYGVGPSEHVEGQHRRYSPADLERLMLMRQAILQGYPPAEAAKLALSSEGSVSTPVDQTAEPTPRGLSLVANTDDENIIDLDGPRASIRALSRAANMLDGQACDRIISNLLERNGVVWTWLNVLCPVLVIAGDNWERNQMGIEVEHVLSESIISQMRNVASSLTDPSNARPVLLAGAPNELHTLPLYVVAAGLAEMNIESRMFGARMPVDAISNAFDRINPSAVLIWSHSRGTADAAVWESLAQLRHMPLLIAGGHGWQEEDLPAEVERGIELQGTLLSLVAATGR